LRRYISAEAVLTQPMSPQFATTRRAALKAPPAAADEASVDTAAVSAPGELTKPMSPQFATTRRAALRAPAPPPQATEEQRTTRSKR